MYSLERYYPDLALVSTGLGTGLALELITGVSTKPQNKPFVRTVFASHNSFFGYVTNLFGSD